MRKLLWLLFRLSLLVLVVLAGIFSVNTIGFSSKQIPIKPIEAVPIEAEAIQRFSKAIQLPTVSDPQRIDTSIFLLLDALIRKSFPVVHSSLELNLINNFSRLYKWPGKNPSLPPILLMAHSDVVPVEVSSVEQWQEEPYSGLVKDGFIWGRGTLDDKNSIFAILEAAEYLLKQDYTPERTIFFAFGHDEEVSGVNGAQAIAEHLRKKETRFEFIMDEGQFIITDALSSLEKPLAMIGVAEKGYVTLELLAKLKRGGHSSMPPPQTAIGVLSAAINKLQENPFPAKIDGATKAMLQHTGPEMSLPYKVLMANLWLTEGMIKRVFGADAGTNAMIRTTTAPTMLKSGIKDNVLPTSAKAVINFRILPGETPESVKEYVEKTIDDERVSISTVEASACKPSPVSETNTFGYQVIQKTVQEIFPDVIVSPSLVIGATVSRFFTEFSDNIYRFMPIAVSRSELNGFHGINERLSVENYHQMIRFYQQLMQNSCK